MSRKEPRTPRPSRSRSHLQPRSLWVESEPGWCHALSSALSHSGLCLSLFISRCCRSSLGPTSSQEPLGPVPGLQQRQREGGAQCSQKSAHLGRDRGHSECPQFKHFRRRRENFQGKLPSIYFKKHKLYFCPKKALKNHWFKSQGTPRVCFYLTCTKQGKLRHYLFH